MIRWQYEIVFKCVCGETHGTDIDVGFPPEIAKQTGADVYGDNPSPQLKEFLEKPFFCRVKQAIVELPSLDSFYFSFVQPIPLVG